MAESGVFEICCPVQKYHWGKKGKSSLVAQLAFKGQHLESIDESTPYAELWMGTHPSCPSKVKGTDKTLESWISEHPECLGSGVKKVFGNKLPFLFKVLSVDTALSIQAHPTKDLAEELHKASPEHYPDSNHKPEIAVALTEFEALCNFRPLSEINRFTREIAELRSLLGSDAEGPLQDKNCLKRCFRRLMVSKKDTFLPLLKVLSIRLADKAKRGVVPDDLAEVYLRIYKTYPEDIGCFVVFFLNYIRLKPGEALFLAANEPHAYISGNCVECMACSDNVVRAGLTPKFKDVDILCSMLTYNSILPTDVKFPPVSQDNCCSTFLPPIRDFAVAKYHVPEGRTHIMKAVVSASIVIVVEGSGHLGKLPIREGCILFISAGKELPIKAQFTLNMYQAYCPA
ncbi:mannose-6-phosphate isomerase-like [Ornithodoros turicata]|uniref:mannose-6-phosphate isomerase-like n=1 Tax=Ornithodoros turicata TaxID=34597 RepID=UPI003138CC62